MMSFFSLAQNFGLCEISSVNMIGWTEPREQQLKRYDFSNDNDNEMKIFLLPNFRLTKHLNEIYKPQT